MPEEMAFQVFASMMQKYGLRELYKAGFENLTLRFYQVCRASNKKFAKSRNKL